MTSVIEPAVLRKTSTTLLSLQVLRAVAAVVVVIHHAGRSVTLLWPAEWAKPPVWLFSSENLVWLGAAGVDVFFLISGFIMVHVSQPYRSGQRPPSDFLIRRLIRIYPMYALVTLGMILFTAVHFYRHPENGVFPESAVRILAAFSFVPTFNGQGMVYPVLGQGWTLFYEMFFYVCFTAVLTFSKRHLLAPLIAIFGVVLLAARVFGAKDSALTAFLSNTIIIEFLFGCTIGFLLQRNAIGPRYGLPLLALSVALFAASVPFGPPEDYRFLVWGVPASLLLLSFVKLELAKVKWSRLSLLIGDASYSIYLVHVFFIIQFRGIFFKKAPQLAGLSADLMILTLSIISVAFGVATYLIIEKPMTAALTGWYREFQKRTITGRVTKVVGS